MNSKARIPLAGLLILALAAASPARAALGLVIGPPAITNDYSSLIVFQITGLNSNGASVRLDKFADFNRNGVIDPEDLLVDSFTVTDGVKPTIGGVRNSNVPGDEDATADQSIQAILFYPGLDRTLSRFAGSYVYRAPSGAASTTQPFVVTQKILPQGVNGRLTSAQSGLPLTNTSVVLIQPDTSGGVGTVTDTNGNYTLYSPPGNYTVAAIIQPFPLGSDVAKLARELDE